jgi:hypothetical protein
LFAIFLLLTARLAIYTPQDRFQTQHSVLLPIAVGFVDYLLSGPELTDPSTWFLLGVAACVPLSLTRSTDMRMSASRDRGVRRLFPKPEPFIAAKRSEFSAFRGDVI